MNSDVHDGVVCYRFTWQRWDNEERLIVDYSTHSWLCARLDAGEFTLHGAKCEQVPLDDVDMDVWMEASTMPLSGGRWCYRSRDSVCRLAIVDHVPDWLLRSCRPNQVLSDWGESLRVWSRMVHELTHHGDDWGPMYSAVKSLRNSVVDRFRLVQANEQRQASTSAKLDPTTTVEE